MPARPPGRTVAVGLGFCEAPRWHDGRPWFSGERDTCPDPHAEPTAYRRSDDITVSITPAMAHMHNFAGTRRLMWDRLASWAHGIGSRS